jgi:hypothetical protein
MSIADACAGDRNLSVAYGVNFFKRAELFKHLPGALAGLPGLSEVWLWKLKPV